MEMMGIVGFLQSVSLLDWIIVLVILFYAFEGYQSGFFAALLDFVSFVLSFALGLRFYTLTAGFLANTFSLSVGFAKAIGFFATSFVSEVVLHILSGFVHSYLAKRFQNKNAQKTPRFDALNRILGIIPGIASAVVLISFLLTVVISLPLSPFLKQIVLSSKLGSYFVSNTQGLEKQLAGVFGEAVHETLTFLTVEPQSSESVNLRFRVQNPTADPQAEQEMFRLVNNERASQGLQILVFDGPLQKVARAHSKDMFARGYFSHYTPEGLSPFDRMNQADIVYLSAGENLALAPNTTLAMQGLMQSPGHRANILSTQFGRVGIGVMDGGIYGEMFTQEFTN